MDNILFTARLMFITHDEIENINKDSSIAYLKALYQCQDSIAVDYTQNTLLTNNIATKNLGYKDDFVNIFILDKESLTTEYLDARKALYKSIMQIKEERQGEYEREQKRIHNLSYEEYERELKEIEREQRQARFNRKDKSKDSNHLILESNDKSIKIIFLDKIDSNQSSNVSSLREVGTTSWQSTTNISLSNLIHLHDNKIDIFTKNGSEIDIESLMNKYHLDTNILHSPNTQIFLYSHLLNGSKEIESHPLYFGELDNDGVFVESKPIYYLQGNEDLSSADSNTMNCHADKSARNDKNISTSTLQVFLHSSTLTILHYSLIHSSLHIKLECNSSESQEIEDKEKALLESKAKDSKENKESISTAFLCPVLEDNELKCPHNGRVQLKSKKGKSFQSQGIPMILESDLMNSSIVGCTHTIAGVPTPCTLVSVILPSARALKRYNDDYPIMQDNALSFG